jgi:pimeloyl-ACP methyl ester carboxylesterase
MMRRGSVTIDGGQLETAWWGPGPSEAPTLVMLHEGLGCVDLWRDVPQRLAAATGWGVFAYSRFGYGQSDPRPLPWPLDYMQQEAQLVLPAVLRAAKIQRMALIGHSDGGSIAAVFAGGDAEPVAPWGVAMLAAHFIVEQLNIDSIARIKADYDAGSLRPRLARYHRNVDIAFRGWNDSWLAPGFRGFDITSFLPGIRCPILALQGSDDPYGSDEQLRVLAAHARGPLQTHIIPDARHAPHLEAEAPTLAVITDFVANLKAAP